MTSDYEGMMKVLVTGVKGFVGRNLVVMLGRQSDVEIIGFDLDDPNSLFDEGLATATKPVMPGLRKHYVIN